MTNDQIILFVIMGSVLGLLVWGRIRYDLVAFAALALAVILGVVNKDTAFSGFGHPAVIIIALVLIVSRALSQSGAVDLLTRNIISAQRGINAHIGIMGLVGGALSAFMNNVAALALLMPVDMQAADKAKRSRAATLMPLSFATILGGMVTMIGTPTNIVIAQFRGSATFNGEPLGSSYSMFDFAPVGLACAVAGLIYISFIGWRFIPQDKARSESAVELENLEGYVMEAQVPEGSPAIGRKVRDLAPVAEENDVFVLGLIRRGERLPGSARGVEIRKGDILVLEADPQSLEQFSNALKLSYSSSSRHKGILTGTLAMTEAVVASGSRVEGRSAHDIRLLNRQQTMLLGVARQGRPFRDRVRRLKLEAGDVLLLMGDKEALPDVVQWLGGLPLVERGLQVTQREKAGLSIAIFALAIVAASFGLVYLPVALAACVAIYALLKVITLAQIYESVEWPVIVLLASLIPIGAAIETSGGTELIANGIVNVTGGWPAWAVLLLLMVVTMTLSDVLNNVATVLVAAPVSIRIAEQLNVNPDAMLMGVAVAASCAFLTPIGHKNNTIIMGPGGYRFGDYWPMGLPLEIIILAVSLPMILVVWPL
ncbi:MAG: SLC13 family permease [Anderseniella sp.]